MKPAHGPTASSSSFIEQAYKRTCVSLPKSGIHESRCRGSDTRFVSTNMTPERRFDFMVDDGQWQDLDEDAVWLKHMFKRLVEEWGTFLDVNLFYDAIIHFRGGEEMVVKDIEVVDGVRLLGRQKAHLLNSNAAFKISSVTKDERHYENHFRRLIRYTSLKAIHWMNFNRHKVLLKTIMPH